MLWSYLKLQWIKGTTFLQTIWAEFTQYISDVWADSAYAIGDVLIGALSGLAGVWNNTLGFMADGWTILTSAVQKGWNNTIGFLKKGFLKLHELVDIAGDVAVQIGGVLINALAGVEKAWVETVDYLADTWTVFVGQVKSMWNSTVGFLKKAWIKLKALFDDDINVDVEMAKIDADTRAAEAAESNSVATKRSSSGNNDDQNANSRSKPTASRCRRASRLNSKHVARHVKVVIIDADMRAIDDGDRREERGRRPIETTTVPRKRFRTDATPTTHRRHHGRRPRHSRPDASRSRKRLARQREPTNWAIGSEERDEKIAAAQAEFEAAVERANNATAPSDALIEPDAPPARRTTETARVARTDGAR